MLFLMMFMRLKLRFMHKLVHVWPLKLTEIFIFQACSSMLRLHASVIVSLNLQKF